MTIARDVTAKKRAEKELRESEEKYSSVVKNSLDGIIVLQKGIIKFLNQAILDLSGYNLEELIDKEFESLLSPEYRKLVMNRYQARLAGKETPSIYEMEIIRKDGISVPIEVSNTTIIYGGEKATLSFIRDITERKKAEQELRESEARLNEAQRIAQIGSWELDLITNTLYWSDEIYRMFDLKPEQFSSTYEGFLDTIHPDDRAFVDKAYTESVKNKIPYDIVHRLPLKDGTLKFVNERCKTFYDDAGKAVRSIGTIQDITDRKEHSQIFACYAPRPNRKVQHGEYRRVVSNE
ncbi:putative diguanylate cyclase DgcE [subsurface metagenome]